MTRLLNRCMVSSSKLSVHLMLHPDLTVSITVWAGYNGMQPKCATKIIVLLHDAPCKAMASFSFVACQQQSPTLCLAGAVRPCVLHTASYPGWNTSALVYSTSCSEQPTEKSTAFIGHTFWAIALASTNKQELFLPTLWMGKIL